MASKGKERENYFRICILVVDHIKNALVNMLKYYLLVCQKNMSFEEFIDAHMEDIKYLRKKNTLYEDEFNKLIVDDNPISGITVDDLEVTLVRRLIDNLCPDLFMVDGCKTLQDFLKKNQHDIFHLFKCNECCQCSQDYTFPVTKPLLKEDQYKNMFKSSPCTNCAGESGTLCSVSSCKGTKYILWDYGTRRKVFEHFSLNFKTMQKLTNLRDKAYGHIDAGVIPNGLYDGYTRDIEDNIMVLATICGNEKHTRLALDDVQKRSCDETLCIQYMISLLEQVKRDQELKEGIDENGQILQEHSQILQKISQQLLKLTEQFGNSKATDTNITKDVGVSCDVIVGMKTLQEANSLTSTLSSGNQSSQIAIVFKAQLNLHSQTQHHQLDDRSLEHHNLQTLNNDIPSTSTQPPILENQNLQTLNNDIPSTSTQPPILGIQNLQTLNNYIPSTSTQPPILGIQNLMNQTNNIERNNLERGQGQKVVVTSGGLMRNSEPQNLHGSVNPTDDQAGAMTSCSPESSSNNLSTGNDQRGQDYQSSIETDAETYISSDNNEMVHDLENENIYDGVVLHAEDDRDAAIEFITNMKIENPDLNINITLYESLFPGKPIFQSAAEIFDICRCLFVFATQNFVETGLEVFLVSIATMKIITSKEKKDRIIPVKASRNCNHHLLDQFLPLNYYHYFEAKKMQQRPDQFFIKSFRQVITDRRQKYLK